MHVKDKISFGSLSKTLYLNHEKQCSMNKKINYKNEYYKDKFFFILLMITDACLKREEIENILGVQGDTTSIHCKAFDANIVWEHCTWVEGSMDFFGEVESILVWMERKIDAFSEIKSKRGVFRLLIGLPGKNFIFSDLSFNAARLIMHFEVNLQVEIFPSLIFGNMDLRLASMPRLDIQGPY